MESTHFSWNICNKNICNICIRPSLCWFWITARPGRSPDCRKPCPLGVERGIRNVWLVDLHSWAMGAWSSSMHSSNESRMICNSTCLSLQNDEECWCSTPGSEVVFMCSFHLVMLISLLSILSLTRADIHADRWSYRVEPLILALSHGSFRDARM